MVDLWNRMIDVLVSPRMIIGLVWSGMAVLTISLVVLMRTRWGHQQPLRKCVVLSLFAHLLFVAYATTVHVVRMHPGHGHGTAFRVTVLDGHDTFDAKGVLDGKDGGKESAPWEVDAPVNPVDPELADFPAADEPLPAEMEVPLAAPTTDALAHVDKDTPDATPATEPDESRGPQPLTPDATETACRRSAPFAANAVRPAADNLAKLVSQTVSATEAPVPTPDEAEQRPTNRNRPKPAPIRPISSEAGLLVAVRPRSPTVVAATQPSSPPAPVVAGTTEKSAATGSHVVPEVYRQRTAPNRLRIAEGYGGSAQTEAAVNAAIDWLVKHQDADGRWDASNHGAGRETRTLGQDRKGAGAQADTGLTGLALLAFLGVPGTRTRPARMPKPSEPPGLNYLLGSQASDGNLAGAAEIYAFMYCHGMATLALSEAYAMTGDARLARPVQRAIAYTVAAQNPASGGWRYKPPYPRERGDTSQLGWQLMSLKSAELSGIAIPERTRQGIVRYLNSVSSGTRGGLASYRPEERPTHPMTAEALVCREFFNLSLVGAGDEAREFLLSALPGQGQANFYYWYYGTLAMFQMQGPAWDKVECGRQHRLVTHQPIDSTATRPAVGTPIRCGVATAGASSRRRWGPYAWKSITAICRSTRQRLGGKSRQSSAPGRETAGWQAPFRLTALWASVKLSR